MCAALTPCMLFMQASTLAPQINLCCIVFYCFRFLRSNALKTKYKNIYRPSTGAVMLLAALHTCDKVEFIITLTGYYCQSAV